MAQRACKVTVSGRVQGVAFRYHAREQALALQVTGWVRNLRDGRVEAHLEGVASAVEAMLAWLERGPSYARVTGVQIHEASIEPFANFEIRRSH
jgi:acylphosphatase